MSVGAPCKQNNGFCQSGNTVHGFLLGIADSADLRNDGAGGKILIEPLFAQIQRTGNTLMVLSSQDEALSRYSASGEVPR